jgi:Flp pilus assembly protein TadG
MMLGSRLRAGVSSRASQRGAGMVESVVVFPLLLFVTLAILQSAMVYHAKSSLNYATYEAARAGTVNNASVASINLAFQKAMLPYYGGGTSYAELAATVTKVVADVTSAAVRVEILSPTQESFADYNSPGLQSAMKVADPVIPSVGLDELGCPRDVPACRSDPKSNASGQTLLDANLLKLRITYGIPKAKQMPIAGRFYTWALDRLGAGTGDAFKQALIDAGRIPVVTSTVMRMQSDAIRNDLMISSPGPGNDGKPTDPGPGPGPGPAHPPLPTCPWWDPSCSTCPGGSTGICTPDMCPAA